LITPNIIVTNNHVADLFTNQFTATRYEQKTKATINFAPNGTDELKKCTIARTLYMDFDYDVALCEIIPTDYTTSKLEPILLEKPAEPPVIVPVRTMIAVFGYPAKDLTQYDAEFPTMLSNIYGEKFSTKRISTGYIIHVGSLTDQDETLTFVSHDCSTLPGNSGSVIVRLDTLTPVALHFQGAYKVQNDAVPIHAVYNALQQALANQKASPKP